MHRASRVWILLACAAALGAQTEPPAAGQPQPAGLDTEWDIGVILGEIGAYAGRLLPELERVDAKAWVAQGASETYAVQLESSKQQARALEAGAKALSQNPEKLAPSLELFFRIEGLDSMLGTLEEGLRKYQSRGDAEALASLAAENGANRERFRQYLVSLAAEREQRLEVMDREAQRCRGIVMSQPPPAVAPATGRKK
jgi:hypothetical protein